MRSPMRFVLTVLAALCISVPALAAPNGNDAKAGPGTAVVKQANDTIAALLKQKVTPGSPDEKALGTKVMASVRDFLDVDELGKAAMADHWGKLTKVEQDD